MKTETSPQPIFLKDYHQPDFLIPTTHLEFDLGEGSTRVWSRLSMVRNGNRPGPLLLNGEGIKPKTVKVAGRVLKSDEYSFTDTHLIIPSVPDKFDLEIETELEPEKNLSCEGLYKSSGMFCTQCEAESFRKITYFLDRPDVMSVFTVVVRADAKKFPVLLSNGNLVSKRAIDGGRLEAVWHDPFKKPCYLFALVAGDLAMLEDKFKTRSGRDVVLQVYARKGLEGRCQHAMDSLKWSMKWDEDTYGLEYDLDIYMIVVAEDFNMGAMENKGLNIFNANYVLANPETATDGDYDAIMSVVAHEYFHNWTGNRVTCRDWFQLSLKEGLTVFRDQRFSSDLTSPAVRRIEEVIRLRTHQFAEDAGPMAHPVRPSSYISIDNFYTTTVYEKGAEVIRMIETIVGRDGFRKGMDLYFKRHDGQAVTTDDFVAAMADANSADFAQFKNWYDQAGTPLVKASLHHDAAKKVAIVTLEQSCPPSPGQPSKKPYHIPVAVGLLGPNGKDLPLQLQAGDRHSPGSVQIGDMHTQVLHLREAKQSFTFTGVEHKPVLSLLRGFSAPVRTECAFTDDELAFLIANDGDAFARWEAAQMLTVRVARNLIADHQAKRPLKAPQHWTAAFGPLLKDEKMLAEDPAYVSFMFSLPAEQYLAQFYSTMDVDAIHTAREHLKRALGEAYHARFREIYDGLFKEGGEGIGPAPAGKRSMKSRALEYIALSDQPEDLERALRQCREAKNMTDELGGLFALNRTSKPARQTALAEFYQKWKNEPLVMNKWLTLQALSPIPDALKQVRKLHDDPVFDRNNPNKIYSLYGAFSRLNLVRFHDKTGEAYRFIADQIMDIDARNPQVASRLVSAFNQMHNLDSERQALMRKELERILGKQGLSSNVYEIASKTLGAPN